MGASVTKKLVFKRAILQPTKNAENLSHLTQKLAFRRAIPQPTKNSEKNL
jgi:hypothetical protein